MSFVLFLVLTSAEPIHEFGSADITELSEPELRQELQIGYDLVAGLQQEVGDLYVTNNQQLAFIVALAVISVVLFVARANVLKQLHELEDEFERSNSGKKARQAAPKR